MPQIPVYTHNEALPVSPGRGLIRAPRGNALIEAGQAIARAGDQIGASFAAHDARVARLEGAEAVSYASKATADAELSLTTLVPEAQKQAGEGARGYAGRIDDAFKQMRDAALAAAPHDTARRLTAERFQGLHLTVLRDALKFESAAARAQRLAAFDSGVDAYGTASFNNPAAAPRYLARLRGDLAAAEATWMLPADASARRAAIDNTVAANAARGLIAGDPAAARTALRTGLYDFGLKGPEKSVLVKAADAAIEARARDAELAAERARKAAERQLKAEREATANDFIARLHDTANPLTATDILKSGLAPTGEASKAFFFKQLDAEAKGTQKAFSEKTYNGLFARVVADPRLDFQKEILPALGNGLDAQHYQQLDNFAATLRSQESQPLKAFFAMAKSQITQSSSVFGTDPQGDRLYYDFTQAAMRAVESARAQDIPVRELTDPKSPRYLGPLVDGFKRSTFEQMDSQMQAFQKEAAEQQRRQQGAAPAAKPAVRVGRQLFQGDEAYDVLGPVLGPDGQPDPGGAVRIRDPHTGREGVWRP